MTTSRPEDVHTPVSYYKSEWSLKRAPAIAPYEARADSDADEPTTDQKTGGSSLSERTASAQFRGGVEQ